MGFVARTWLAPSGDGRLEVFVPGTDDNAFTVSLWHLYQTAPGGGWSQWVSHGSAVSTKSGYSWPVVGASADGRLELFMTFDSATYHIWQTAANNGWTPNWSAVETEPEFDFGRMAMARRADGCLELFALDVALWHSGQTAPNNGWSDWESLHGPATGGGYATVGASADGRLEVFLVGVDDGALWHIWQTPDGGWSDWISHGLPPGTKLLTNYSPAICANSEGRLELFATGWDGALWHLWQTAPNGGWSSWTSHGAPPGAEFILGSGPSVAASADGRLELFIVGGDEKLWHINQMSPSGAWCQWYSHDDPLPPPESPNLGLQPQTPAVALNAQGRLELFAVAADSALWHMWQTAPNSGWSSWLSHGTPPGCTIVPAG